MQGGRRVAKLLQSMGACLALLTLGSIGTTAYGQTQATTVSVVNNHFVLDGRPWTPKGFTWVGYVAPVRALMGPAYLHARSMDEGLLLRQAANFGANTIRIQVSQPGLDPSSPIYDPSYLNQVETAVRRARQSGFVVIVSMQWEKPAGLPGQPDMPSQSTIRAWLPLLHAFGSDRGILLELFNEPGMWETNPAAWPTWQSGMQALVNEARANGARNVLLLDGIHGAHLLAGAPPIHDPLNQIAYAVHPYMSAQNATVADWDRQWGHFAESHPVVITEWNETSALKFCQSTTPTYAQQLVSYLAVRHIGLIIWAQDLPSTVVTPTGQPLDFSHFACGYPGWAATSAAVNYFKAR